MSFLQHAFSGPCSNYLLSILYPPFQYLAPDQAPTSCLEATRASHLSNGVPSEAALPALAELTACHDTDHPVTLSLSDVPQPFFWIPLLLPALTQLFLISSLRPLVTLVSQRSCWTPHLVCCVREVRPPLFQNKLTFNVFLLNQLPISIKSMPVLHQVHSHCWVGALLGRS